MTDLLDLFDEMERDNIDPTEPFVPLKAPFAYPGGKSRSIKYITPHLPHRENYVEPFGGSAAVMLAKPPCKLDIFNDAYAGVVSFYRCLRDPILMEKLIQWLDLTVNSREEFWACKETWANVNDPVERAGRWYFMTTYSFGSLGRNWGSAKKGATGGISGRVTSKLKDFPIIHERFRKVQIENLDALECMKRYDGPNTVFYLDPPYIGVDSGIYKHKTDISYHRRLIDTVFSMEGFVALSGYPNELYDSQNWTSVRKWESLCSISSTTATPTTVETVQQNRETAIEKLWIKEAKAYA